MLAYFDLYVGVSGDMVLGALLDVGLPMSVLEDTVDALGLSGVASITAKSVHKGSLVGTKVDVRCAEGESHRGLADIIDLIHQASLPDPVTEQSKDVFESLAKAEARVHGVTPNDVHFHEVGALDAIIDVVGAVAGLHAMGVTQVWTSPVPVAHGMVDTAHGRLPVPAPATAVLLEGVPVCGLDIEAETVTPTGAALMITLADGHGPMPAMTLRHVGHGAGAMDLTLPNMVRLFLGEAVEEKEIECQALTLMSSNIDDMPGEWFGPLFEQLLGAGALDVWLTPIQMKKNRPALEINVLSDPATVPRLRRLLFRETTTLGVREQAIVRRRLPRTTRTVRTPWGLVRLKVALMPDGGEKTSPEFEDCQRLAQKHRVPLWHVYRTALGDGRDPL